MIKRYLRTSVAFDDVLIGKLDELCERKKTTRSALIRDAVHAYVSPASQSSENAKREAMLSEFTQVAVDVLIREQAPERREEILATVQDRMERYHA